MKNLTAGQRISYMHYPTGYSRYPEQLRHGSVCSVSADGFSVNIRNDASGIVVTVLKQHLVTR